MGKVGRPPFVPTRSQRKQVMLWIATGTIQESAARLIGISVPVFRKVFKKEILTAKDAIRTGLVGVTYRRAIKGSERATEFLLKTQFGFKETAVHEIVEMDLDGLDDDELAVVEKALRKKAGG